MDRVGARGDKWIAWARDAIARCNAIATAAAVRRRIKAPTNSPATDDVVDVRDVIARIEELEENDDESETCQIELEKLRALLDKWRGDSYPLLLIRDSHFHERAYELATEFFKKTAARRRCNPP